MDSIRTVQVTDGWPDLQRTTDKVCKPGAAGSWWGGVVRAPGAEMLCLTRLQGTACAGLEDLIACSNRAKAPLGQIRYFLPEIMFVRFCAGTPLRPTPPWSPSRGRSGVEPVEAPHPVPECHALDLLELLVNVAVPPLVVRQCAHLGLPGHLGLPARRRAGAPEEAVDDPLAELLLQRLQRALGALLPAADRRRGRGARGGCVVVAPVHDVPEHPLDLVQHPFSPRRCTT
eukprot:CAMPEP_0179219924 /NCGR_PEP_ID=MMETSP0797-20121207/5308_1 /TAXON_ID=47934 /ORGANISM="Dinophysis acuminata, Strain DAEP01" /LENGTH=229 /DNA_ID=CAMNT_0020926455 /DNA_START=75 /DNA_END=765 /DNA_ORIENTATION=+